MKQSPEAQFQAARTAPTSGQPGTPQAGAAHQPGADHQPDVAQPAAEQAGVVQESGAVAGGAGRKRPSNLALAGAGSVLAVLAFLGGMAVGHSWDGSSNQQGQFGGPGGGRGGFPGNGQGFRNGNGTGQSNGNGQGTLPGNGTQQGSPGQTQTG